MKEKNKEKGKKVLKFLRIVLFSTYAVFQIISINNSTHFIDRFLSGSDSETAEYEQYEEDEEEQSETEKYEEYTEEEKTEEEYVEEEIAEERKSIYDMGDTSLWYGYNQLTEQEQKSYLTMYEKIAKGDASFYVEIPEADDAEAEICRIYAALFADHPEFFWLSPSCSWSHSFLANKNDYYFTVGEADFWELLSKKNKQKYKDEFEEKVFELTEMTRAEGSPFGQVKFIHDYLVKNLCYDHDAADSDESRGKYWYARSAYGSIMGDRVVCVGYARAFQIVMNNLGYDCAYISGKTSEGGHAWNLIKLENDYYWMDVTWDDWDLKEYPDGVSYDYFCVTDSIMEQSRTPDEFPPVPECNAVKYEYCRAEGAYFDYYDYQNVLRAAIEQKDNQMITLKFRDSSVMQKAFVDMWNIEKEAAKYNRYYTDYFGYEYNNEKASIYIYFK